MWRGKSAFARARRGVQPSWVKGFVPSCSRIPDAAPGADSFDRMEATFSLAQQTINASEFLMRSPDSDIDGRGTLSLTSKTLDGAAELRLGGDKGDVVRIERTDGVSGGTRRN